MKLKIFVFKRKQLYFTGILLAVIVIAVVFLLSIKTGSTFSMLATQDSYKADMNNDGKIDTVVVNKDDAKEDYILSVVCSNNREYELTPDPVIHSFGSSKMEEPLKISFRDVVGDKGEELFVQGNDLKGPILNVFSFANDQIMRIASGRYSFFGVIRKTDGDGNQLILGTRNGTSLKFTYLDSDGSRLLASNTNRDSELGADLLGSVIGYIEQTDITSLYSNDHHSILSKLERGKVLDLTLDKASYDSSYRPIQLSYRIRVASQTDNPVDVKSYRIDLYAVNNQFALKDIR